MTRVDLNDDVYVELDDSARINEVTTPESGQIEEDTRVEEIFRTPVFPSVPDIPEEHEYENNCNAPHQPLFEPDLRWLRDHPQGQIIGNIREGVRTRGSLREAMFACFLSQTEPKEINEALNDPDWVQAMQEELHQFERNDVWELVPRPTHQNVIRTKWVFRNKMNE